MAPNERDLGAALLKLDAADLNPTIADRKQIWQVVERDRRRLRGWTILTVAVWLPAVLGIFAVLIYLALLFPLQAKLAQVRQQQKTGEVEPGDTYIHDGRELNLKELEESTNIGFKMMSVLTAFSVLTLCAATLCSLILITASRRATLRQINASLLEIADQLRKREAS